MEAVGVVKRLIPCSSSSVSQSPSVGAGCQFPGKSRTLSFGRRKFCGSINLSYSDDGYMKFYGGPRCGSKTEREKVKVEIKKKSKLLKGLSKNLSMFSDMSFGVNPEAGLVSEVQGKMISEASEVLLKQLKQLRAEEKELKKKRKEEKNKNKKNKKNKALKMKTLTMAMSSSSSSSESSDSECGEVVDMSSMRANNPLDQPKEVMVQELTTTKGIPSSSVTDLAKYAHCSLQKAEEDCCSRTSAGGAKRIEVCMGGKCKKSGAPALLEEFGRAVGGLEADVEVVGCKCMGKCRSAPNVKVVSTMLAADGDSVRTPPPANPLCIGVGLQDVGTIIAKFLSQGSQVLESVTTS